MTKGVVVSGGDPAPMGAERAWMVLLLALLLIGSYRAWVTVHERLPLFFDEAQYWAWSLKPDWGYYSKPPMVAWLIRLSGAFGSTELAVRLGTLLLHPLAAMLVYALGRRMFDARTALVGALIFISLPLVGFNSLFMTTDAPLLFFWGLAAYALWRAFAHDAMRHWLLLGAAVGFGMLSKYSMALFAPSLVLALCLPAYRRHWRNPRLYLGASLALLIFLPNLWWNARMDFVSVRHTAEISQLGGTLFHPAMLAQFAAAQFGCMGPLAFSLLLVSLASPATWRDPKLAFLAALTLPVLALIALQALLAKANANWAAPAYFAGSLLVAACCARRERQRYWLALAVIVSNLAILSSFYHYHALARAADIQLTRKTDPYARLLGWPQAGDALSRMLARHPDAKLAVATRDEFALLNYYARPDGIRIWNPERRKRNHFHLDSDIAGDLGANFVFAVRTPLGADTAASFEHWTALGKISVPLYPGDDLTLHLYRGDSFRGYRP